jgi:LmbE family N-acetylglucosaminyl deacetylase
MMVSMLTTAAFHWSGQAQRYTELGAVHRAERLFYLSTNFFLPGRPRTPMPMPWTATLDVRSVRVRKEDAFRQHVSQAPLMEETKAVFDRYGAEEFYSLVATAEPQPARLSTDLFEGL